MMGNKSKLSEEDDEYYEKKPITPIKHQINASARNIITQIPFLKSPVSWIFITLFLIYVIYSSSLLLSKNRQKCSPSSSSTTSNHLISRDHIQSLTNVSSSSSSLSSTSSSHDSLFEKNKNFLATQATSTNHIYELPKMSQRFNTTLDYIVFGIGASSILWETRKEYIKSWWRPGVTRGIVWMEKKISLSPRERRLLPDIRVSSDTSNLRYTHWQGDRSALRISRVVSETLRLGLKDVRWFVMGDDDTIFVAENVARVLSKYDHNQLYYVGSSSESHVQNIFFSYSMAFGGGGFAISYPLAIELEKMQDRCIQRYPGLYGSDDRIQACMAELGVPLTKDPGFHQYDVYGDLLGLLGAHPVSPLVSLHHIDVVQPIFPGKTRAQALNHLFESAKLDSASIIQQSICYDKDHFWSISVSWGFVVQISRGVISPRELEMPSRTFLNWFRRADYFGYAFNTRPVSKHPCQRPFIFYLSSAKYDKSRKQIIGYYSVDKTRRVPQCRWKMESPQHISTVVVLKRPDPLRWTKSPRRDCCRVMPTRRNSTMYLWVGNCRDGEISEVETH